MDNDITPEEVGLQNHLRAHRLARAFRQNLQAIQFNLDPRPSPFSTRTGGPENDQLLYDRRHPLSPRNIHNITSTSGDLAETYPDNLELPRSKVVVER